MVFIIQLRAAYVSLGHCVDCSNRWHHRWRGRMRLLQQQQTMW